MKYILANTPKGQYKIPLQIVAENRANHYADHRAVGELFDREEEIAFVMEDDFEGIDWLLNNMDWDDVKDKAIKVNDKVMVTDDDFFTSSDDFDIIEE